MDLGGAGTLTALSRNTWKKSRKKIYISLKTDWGACSNSFEVFPPPYTRRFCVFLGRGTPGYLLKHTNLPRTKLKTCKSNKELNLSKISRRKWRKKVAWPRYQPTSHLEV